VTITEAFTITVTASNVSLTTPAIYTPPPPCQQSVVPAASHTACRGECPAFQSAQLTETNTGSAYTSTVLVTKKTPVPTVVPDTSAPPDFHISSTSAPHVNSVAPSVQQGSTAPAIQTPGLVPEPNTSKGSSPEPAPESIAVPDVPEVQTTAVNAGSLINSGVNAFALPTPAPTSANVKGVPVVVLPSSSGVVIGGQVVSIPPSDSKTTVVANGNTFTLGKSSVIGPGATIALAVDNAPTPVTVNGLTLNVGATQAIISGTTYAIGAGAPTTTLTIGGQTIVVGPSGVGVPGKTIAPAKATGTAPLSVVTAGGVTITYDNTEAIVGSSTYRIGQGAPQTVITVNGKTVSLGAGGIGLASSTIPPTKVTAGPSLSAVTADGVSFSVDATEVVFGSSTFRIGSGAPTKTTVINGETISIGPSGVGLAHTTIPPPTGTGGLRTTGAALSTTQQHIGSSMLFGLTTLLGCLLI
jgi:hypothetical protein